MVNVLSDELFELMREHETVLNELNEADNEATHLQLQLDAYVCKMTGSMY